MFSLSLNPADEQLQEQKRRKCRFMRPTFEQHHSGLVMVLKLNHSLASHRLWNCTLLEANVTTNFINKHFELSMLMNSMYILSYIILLAILVQVRVY